MTDNSKNPCALEKFLSTGIHRIPDANAFFLDPVRMLNTSYTHFCISSRLYYARSLPSSSVEVEEENQQEEEEEKKKRPKKRKRSAYILNEKEELAQKRHMDIRPFLSSAYESFLKDPNLSSMLCSLKDHKLCAEADNAVVDNQQENDSLSNNRGETNPSFVELGKLWQAPLYEVFVHNCVSKLSIQDDDETAVKQDIESTLSLFNTLIKNESNDEAIAECLSSCYILPRHSSFLMSDINKIHQLIPVCLSDRFNLILIDPPWENKSVHRRSIYPTLPNRNLFSIPLRQLAHPEGALVALWVTNREKLRTFVEKDLFPAWGITYAASLYWLKVTENGCMISKLDLTHHKPYECILLGYVNKQGNGKGDEVIEKMPLDKHVVISVPGDHSRKPPIGNLLLDYAPGPKPVRGLELFARELLAGWTSWGNEPLLFQHSRYFLDQRQKNSDV